MHKELKLFSYGKFNIISFFNNDHGPRDGSSLKNWVLQNLKKNNMLKNMNSNSLLSIVIFSSKDIII